MVLLFGGIATHAAPYRLEPFKDDLFAYKTILQTEYGGDFLVVDHDRPRDLYARDVVERQKVKPEYVDLATKAVRIGSIDQGGRTEGRVVRRRPVREAAPARS